MAASSSFEGSGSSGNTNQPRERESITCMDPEFYEAAAKGNIEFFKVHGTHLNVQLTPNKNTVLHIYITALVAGAESPTNFVDEVLKIHPLLLWQANANDEIPLHIAARYGHTAVIKFLLERANYHILYQDLESGFRSAREMLGMTNKEKDTALHEAVRYNHLEAAKLLMVEDPEFSYFDNAAGETPLYMAAERKLQSMVSEIINTCKSPAYNGPLGRTALHAAACWEEPEVIKLIQKIGGISKEADQKGWTPLHLAAHYNKNESTKLLLEYYRDVAYMKDTEGRTALHIAAHHGHHMVMEKIISSCPDCCELVDNRGWNALHFAAEGPVLDDFKGYQHIKLIIGAILDNRSLGNLLNQKDADGNTPLHHLLRRSSYWLDTNDHRLTNGIDNLFFDPRVDQMAFNNENLHAWEIALTAADVSTRKVLPCLGVSLVEVKNHNQLALQF
ncbi:hypothetical protein F2P56_015980 [Juglans regia]|uniref:Death-associated protein kinase 1-like n=2 Tax=Juglans regia TaxID=51240 RepID=A0A2I4E1X4_JUGRE|nr:death-associated protein kinase 1-like [Juglans regia]KAF5466021.1 hypothetical protein F2P56_015980 [Juglans regia]